MRFKTCWKKKKLGRVESQWYVNGTVASSCRAAPCHPPPPSNYVHEPSLVVWMIGSEAPAQAIPQPVSVSATVNANTRQMLVFANEEKIVWLFLLKIRD